MNRKIELELLFGVDVEVLLYLLQEFPQYCKHLPEDKHKDYIRIILELDKFVAIHRTRTTDLLTITDKIETARMQYGILRERNKNLEAKVKELEDLNSKIMDEYFEDGSIPTQKPLLP